MRRSGARRSAAGALALLAACLPGCAGIGREPRIQRLEGAGEGRPATWQGLPLASGQLVLSEDGGALGVFFTLFAEEFTDYVHAGLLALEDGRPYVYESVGIVWPSFGGPPTGAIRGSVRRLPLRSFLRRHQFVSIFDPPPELDVGAALAFARAARDHMPFDPYFGPDPDSLYCTEFVAAALAAGGAPPVHRTPLRNNPSLRVVLHWLGIEAESVILAKDLVDPGREVARLSLWRHPEEAPLHFAMKRELYQRFTPDQRLGAVFRWGLGTLHLRTSVAGYLAAGRERGKHDPPPDARSARRVAAELARSWLGPEPGLLKAEGAPELRPLPAPAPTGG